jgi:hypothetical protein
VSSIAAPASLPCSPVALSIHHKDDEIQPAQQRVRAACSNCLAQTEVFTPMGSCLLLSLMLPQVAVAVWKNPSSVGALGGIRTPDPQIRKDCSRITGLESVRMEAATRLLERAVAEARGDVSGYCRAPGYSRTSRARLPPIRSRRGLMGLPRHSHRLVDRRLVAAGRGSFRRRPNRR